MSEPNAELIEQTLDSILQNPSFRSSKQCQALLRYIVKHSVAQQENMLRERVIGNEVFGRSPDYDCGNDPIVRSRVAEVRKRLAQHYMQQGDSNPVRIDIPSGSYRAVFELHEATKPVCEGLQSVEDSNFSCETLEHQNLPAEPDSLVIAGGLREVPRRQPTNWIPSAKRRFRVFGALAALLLVLIGLGWWWLFPAPNVRAFNHFWFPIVHSKQPTMVYFGGSFSYHLSSAFLDGSRSEQLNQKPAKSLITDIQSGDVLNESNLVSSNEKIGLGDVTAIARISSALTSMGKRYNLRYGNDISVTDLHASPTVLIGGFSNRWALQLMHDLRFTLDQGGIFDQQQHKLVWQQGPSPDGLRHEDYVIISRIPSSAMGNFTLIIAGINTFSNQSAADFLCEPEKIGALVRGLPAGWENKRLQIVLHTEVMNQIPMTTDVVSVYVW